MGQTEDLAGAGLWMGKKTGFSTSGSASVREGSVQGLGRADVGGPGAEPLRSPRFLGSQEAGP